MSLTKTLAEKLASAPTATSLSGLSMPLINSSGNLSQISPHILLAMLLLPNATVYTRSNVNWYTRDQIRLYSTGDTYWGVNAQKAGDVLLLFGTTADTNQQFVYFFQATSRRNSEEWNGRCFLLLLEGERPLWANTSSQ